MPLAHLDPAARDGTPRAQKRAPALLTGLASLFAILLSGCDPTVRVEAPKDPIVINLNVKIEQEVRIKLENDVENLLESEDDLF